MLNKLKRTRLLIRGGLGIRILTNLKLTKSDDGKGFPRQFYLEVGEERDAHY